MEHRPRRGAGRQPRLQDARTRRGYFPVPPTDHYADLRDSIVRNMIDDRLHRRARAPRGRHRRPGRDQLQVLDAAARGRPAAAVQVHREEHGLGTPARRATFMPKPLFGDNGSGMHTHQSLWPAASRCSTTRPATAACRTSPAGTSAACCTTPRRCWPSPTRRSTRTAAWYPGFEAPVNLVYSQRNRSACTRIPVTGTNAKAKRIEFRVPDPSCNAYLAFSAMLMAGLDGIKNKIEPPAPIDKDLYDLPPEEFANVHAGAGLAARGAGVAGGRPRVPAGGRRVHAGPHRDLDRLQDAPTRSTRSGCARPRTSSRCTTTCSPQ